MGMPGKHNEKTKLLGFYAEQSLVAKAHEARNGNPMSQLLREAMCDYIAARGVAVPEHLRHPIDRTGKGGPRKYPAHKPSSAALNEGEKGET